MNRLLLATVVAVTMLSMSGAQGRRPGTLPPDPKIGPVEVIHALFVKAQMIHDGQVMFIFILSMAAAEVSVGLALVLLLYHRFKTLDADAAANLRG